MGSKYELGKNRKVNEYTSFLKVIKNNEKPGDELSYYKCNIKRR